MNRKKIEYAFLLPADDELRKMYEKLGFITVSKRQAYTVNSGCDFSGYTRITSINDENISALSKIYNKQMTGKCLYVTRDIRRWQLTLDDLLNISGGKIFISDDSYVILANDSEVQELMGEVPSGIVYAKTIPYAMLWSKSNTDLVSNIDCNYFNLLL